MDKRREAGFYVGCHIKYNGLNPIQNTQKKSTQME
jgi:hypothetical protein